MLTKLTTFALLVVLSVSAQADGKDQPAKVYLKKPSELHMTADQCYDAWLAWYKERNGEEALVTSDADEVFEQYCKQDKPIGQEDQ